MHAWHLDVLSTLPLTCRGCHIFYCTLGAWMCLDVHCRSTLPLTCRGCHIFYCMLGTWMYLGVLCRSKFTTHLSWLSHILLHAWHLNLSRCSLQEYFTTHLSWLSRILLHAWHVWSWTVMHCQSLVSLTCWDCCAACTLNMYLGFARTVYIRLYTPYIWWYPSQKYRMYTVYIWFWPTLHVLNETIHALQEY
jgi:hypothetical protein